MSNFQQRMTERGFESPLAMEGSNMPKKAKAKAPVIDDTEQRWQELWIDWRIRGSKKPPSVFPLPMVEGDLMGWFNEMARLYGYNPRNLAYCSKILECAGIDETTITEELLDKAVKDSYPFARQWAEEYNAVPETDRKKGDPTYIDRDYQNWHVWNEQKRFQKKVSTEPGPSDNVNTDRSKPDERRTDMAKYKLELTTAAEILKACGVKETKALKSVEAVQEKINLLHKSISEVPETLTDAPLRETMEDILDRLHRKQSVTVVDGSASDSEDDDNTEEKEEKAVKTKDKKASKPVKASKADKPAKKGPTGPRGVGVCATIVECYQKASKKKPVTKAEILEVLTKKFPDRDPDKMKSTVSGSPTWIPLEKKLTVERDGEGGFWIKA